MMKKLLVFLAACAALMDCGEGDNGGCRLNTDCMTAEYCNHHTGECVLIKQCNQVYECVNLCCSDPCSTGSNCPDNCGAGQACNYSTCQCEAC